MKTPHKDSAISTADRVLAVASAVLREEGASALTTRRVCELAGVTAPTLYHHFGDKHGLMRALAGRELHSFFAEKRSMRPTADAVADLMRGWDDWIGFARAKPQLVAALRQGDDGTIALRQAAEAIVMERLERLPSEPPLRVPKHVAAQALVAGANTVVQLMLDGVAHRELDKVNALLKGALLMALLGPAGTE
jgi:AcrR family transcriptional regulator